MKVHSPAGPRRIPASRQTGGFTLVEVLVTVVVISVGLLGIAALQATTLRDNYSSFLRGQASALADDIFDRMRANRDNATAYEVGLAGTLSGTSRAAQDVGEWKAQLNQLLPQRLASGAPATANGAIDVTELTGTRRFLVEVTIEWGERDSDNPMQFITRTEI